MWEFYEKTKNTPYLRTSYLFVSKDEIILERDMGKSRFKEKDSDLKQKLANLRYSTGNRKIRIVY